MKLHFLLQTQSSHSLLSLTLSSSSWLIHIYLLGRQISPVFHSCPSPVMFPFICACQGILLISALVKALYCDQVLLVHVNANCQTEDKPTQILQLGSRPPFECDIDVVNVYLCKQQRQAVRTSPGGGGKGIRGTLLQK